MSEFPGEIAWTTHKGLPWFNLFQTYDGSIGNDRKNQVFLRYKVKQKHQRKVKPRHAIAQHTLCMDMISSCACLIYVVQLVGLYS